MRPRIAISDHPVRLAEGSGFELVFLHGAGAHGGGVGPLSYLLGPGLLPELYSAERNPPHFLQDLQVAL